MATANTNEKVAQSPLCHLQGRVQSQMGKARSNSPARHRTICIGTAGWTLPKQHAQHFPETGTHLERCAQGFNCVEVNSSFHRPHRRKTWERWARCTPP